MGKLIINLYLTPSLSLNRSQKKKLEVNAVHSTNRMRRLKTKIKIKRESSLIIKKVKVRVKAKQKYTGLLPST